MSGYKIIAPPFTLTFDEMSKEELKAYYKWYLAQIPERISILAETVRSSPGYEDWDPDYSPESLDRLGEWFAANIETREMTEEEMAELRASAHPLLRDIEYENWELTNKTISLAMDIGMYLSQVFLKNIPSLKWQHRTTGSKNWIHYGRPVIVSFGAGGTGGVFEPTHMMLVQASAYADKTWSGAELRKVFEYWKKLAVS